jgi:mRNA interferase MazF
MQPKDFDTWNEKKKIIDATEFRAFVHEREIWWCSLGLNVGDEEDGKNDLFERPVLVLKKFNRNIILTAPLTTRVKNNKYYFPFKHDGTQFAVVLSQLRLISTKRLTRRIRKIDHTLFRAIKEQIKKVSL